MEERIRNLSERAEFLLVISISFAYFISSSLVVLVLRIHEFELTTGRLLRGIAVEIGILLIVGWFLSVRGWRLSRLGPRPSWSALLAGIPLLIACYALYGTARFLVVSAYPAAANLATVRMVPKAPLAVVIAFILVNSVFEEALVTGYVVTVLAEQGAALAITASALLRFLYHLYQGPIASLAVLPLGIVFAAVYWRWKTLWPLIVAHTIANAIAYAVAASRAV